MNILCNEHLFSCRKHCLGTLIFNHYMHKIYWSMLMYYNCMTTDFRKKNLYRPMNLISLPYALHSPNYKTLYIFRFHKQERDAVSYRLWLCNRISMHIQTRTTVSHHRLCIKSLKYNSKTWNLKCFPYLMKMKSLHYVYTIPFKMDKIWMNVGVCWFAKCSGTVMAFFTQLKLRWIPVFPASSSTLSLCLHSGRIIFYELCVCWKTEESNYTIFRCCLSSVIDIDS